MTCLPCTPTGSWRSQPHAGEKRRSEREDTSQPAKRERLDGQCCVLYVLVIMQDSKDLDYTPPVASLKDLMSILCKTEVPSNLKQFGIMLDFDKTFLDYIKVKNQDSFTYRIPCVCCKSESQSHLKGKLLLRMKPGGQGRIETFT